MKQNVSFASPNDCLETLLTYDYRTSKCAKEEALRYYVIEVIKEQVPIK